MSLDNFAKSCGVQEYSKTVYPYEKWLCPKAIRRCKKFPPYTDFMSSLSLRENDLFIKEFEDLVNYRLKVEEWTSKK
jgi:hypothetical protein